LLEEDLEEGFFARERMRAIAGIAAYAVAGVVGFLNAPLAAMVIFFAVPAFFGATSQGLSELHAVMRVPGRPARRRRRPERRRPVAGPRRRLDSWRRRYFDGGRPRPGPNRAVNTLPLSVKICSGTPCARIAKASASHTGRAVARATTQADTAKREWSSMPDTIFASDPSRRRTPPTMSICHSSIARERSDR
jgi:hypothetical protein